MTHVQATSHLVCNNRCIGYVVLVINKVGHETESVMEIKVGVLCCVKRVVQVSCTVCQSCIVHVEYLTTIDGFAPGWGFLGFLIRDFVPREWIVTTIFRKISNPHPLPDSPPPPPSQGHNINRYIINIPTNTFFVRT